MYYLVLGASAVVDGKLTLTFCVGEHLKQRVLHILDSLDTAAWQTCLQR
jgi:hypothetical protein